MGVKLTKFDFVPQENEQLEAAIIMPEEKRSVIHGVVKDCEDRTVKDAVVKLFLLEHCPNPCSLKPLTHAFTDECGQFLFGPLCPHKQYVIKIWYDNVRSRTLNISTDDCTDAGDDCAETDGNGKS